MNQKPITIDKNIITDLAHKHGLSLVVLFGSQATGKAHPGSDTDIAFLSKWPKNTANVALLQQEFVEQLSPAHFNMIDLDSKSGLFMKEVAEKGQILYQAHPSSHAEFSIYALKIYMEDNYRHELQREQSKKLLQPEKQAKT